MLQAFQNALPVSFIRFDSPTTPNWISQYFQFTWSSDLTDLTEITFIPPNTYVQPVPNNIYVLFESSLLLSCANMNKAIVISTSAHTKSVLHMIHSLRTLPPSAFVHTQLSCSITTLISEIIEYASSHQLQQSPPIKSKSMVLIKARYIIYATRFMKKNMSNPHLCLGDIAKSIGYHPNYFCHEFSQIFAQSPIRYLNQLRLERTLQLLENSNYTVKDICKLVGIINSSRLCTMVKLHSGMTPIAYRRSQKNIYLKKESNDGESLVY